MSKRPTAEFLCGDYQLSKIKCRVRSGKSEMAVNRQISLMWVESELVARLTPRTSNPSPRPCHARRRPLGALFLEARNSSWRRQVIAAWRCIWALVRPMGVSNPECLSATPPPWRKGLDCHMQASHNTMAVNLEIDLPKEFDGFKDSTMMRLEDRQSAYFITWTGNGLLERYEVTLIVTCGRRAHGNS